VAQMEQFNIFFYFPFFFDLWLYVLKQLGVHNVFPNKTMQHAYSFCCLIGGVKALYMTCLMLFVSLVFGISWKRK